FLVPRSMYGFALPLSVLMHGTEMSNFCEARPVISMTCWRAAKVFATICVALSLLGSTGCYTKQPDQQ
ncbi:MAG: hypothetical protein WA673_22155, partial [Candidatus Acidiferrales bacterium]